MSASTFTRETESPSTATTSPPPMSRAKIRRRLLTIARPVLAPIGGSIFFRAVGLILGIALLGVVGWGVGRVADPTTRASVSIGAIVAVLVVISLVKGLARYLEQFLGHFVAFRALAILRVFFYNALEPQAPAAVEGRRSGDLLSRVTKDVDRVEVFFAHTLAPAVTAVIVPVLTLAWFALAVDPMGALVLAIFLVVVAVAAPALGGRPSAKAATMLRASRGDVAQHVSDSVQGVREVIAFGYGPRRLDELAQAGQGISSGISVLGRWIAIRRGVNVALVAAAVICELAILGSRLNAPGDLPMLFAGLAVTLAAFAPVLAVEDFVADLEQAYASARRVFEVTDAQPIVPDDGTHATPSAAPSVEFNSVTFSYPAGLDAGAARSRSAIADVTFTAPAGKVTAVVGASGSGKSTLASLLVRAWDVDSGSVSLDGVDVRAMPLAALREAVGVSTQRPYIFNDSIEANLRMALPQATLEQIACAARRSALDAVIDGEPDGLATAVGEMGERLSGGQRQRLALARMLIRDPSVLVLDEATSQLDAETESRVLAGVREAGEDKTVIVIAHRLSTIEDADLIVVLDGGRVVEQGTHQELAAAGGAYAQLRARESDSLDR